MEKDWDNLIILDACRWDTFSGSDYPEGRLETVLSMGSHTSEFLAKNFTQDYADTIYLSATPQVARHVASNKFYKVIHIWKDHWDERGTVHPRDVVDVTKNISDKYPNKKLIVHFLQPHYPFLSQTGEKLPTSKVGKEQDEGTSIWKLVRKGDVQEEIVKQAYRENLEFVLPYVNQVLDYLKGKSVVTSDHGNMLGEYGVWGHPPKTYYQHLVNVPWLVIDGDRRKRIISGDIGSSEDSITRKDIGDKLRDLGYLT